MSDFFDSVNNFLKSKSTTNKTVDKKLTTMEKKLDSTANTKIQSPKDTTYTSNNVQEYLKTLNGANTDKTQNSVIDKVKNNINLAKGLIDATISVKKSNKDRLEQIQQEKKIESDTNKLNVATNKILDDNKLASSNKDLKLGLTLEQIDQQKKDASFQMLNAQTYGDTKTYEINKKEFDRLTKLENDTKAINTFNEYKAVMEQGTDEDKENYKQMLINAQNNAFEDFKLANESSYDKLVASMSKEVAQLTNNQDLSEYATKMLEESDKNLALALSGREGMDALALKYFGGNSIQLTGDALTFFINPTTAGGKLAMWGAETIGDVLQASGETRIRLEQQGFDEDQINANVIGNAVITATSRALSRYSRDSLLQQQINNNFVAALNTDASVRTYNALTSYLLRATGSEVAATTLSATGSQFLNVLGTKTAKTLLDSETLGGNYKVNNVNELIEKVWNGGDFVVDELMACLLTAISTYSTSKDIYERKEYAYSQLANVINSQNIIDPNSIKSESELNTAKSIRDYFILARDNSTDFTKQYDDIINGLNIQIENFESRKTNISLAITSTADISAFDMDLNAADNVGLYSVQPNIATEMQKIKDDNAIIVSNYENNSNINNDENLDTTRMYVDINRMKSNKGTNQLLNDTNVSLSRTAAKAPALLDVPTNSLQGNDNNINDNYIDTNPNYAMTMNDAKNMLDRTWAYIKEWYKDDKDVFDVNSYITKYGDDAISELAMYIDNTWQLQRDYVNANEKVLNAYNNGYYDMEDIIKSYWNGTLTNSNNNNIIKDIDMNVVGETMPKTFYSPRTIDDAKNQWELAKQDIRKADREQEDLIANARENMVIYAHDPKNIEELGITKAELNKYIRRWAGYSKNALDLSTSLNKDIPMEYKWSGLENTNILNRWNTGDEIPLEQRFNNVSNDIRFSKGLTDEERKILDSFPKNKENISGLSKDDEKAIAIAQKEIKQQLTDSSRRLNVKEELNLLVNDIYQTGEITEDNYNKLKEKVKDSTLIKVPNDQYGIKTDIINNYLNGTPFLKKDGWDKTMEEIENAYSIYPEGEYPTSYEDAKIILKDFFKSIGDKYQYYTPVEMGMMSQDDYDYLLENGLSNIVDNLKYAIQNEEIDDKAMIEYTNEKLSNNETNLIDKLMINDTLGNREYVDNMLNYIRRNTNNESVKESAIKTGESNIEDLIKNESKYLYDIIQTNGIASLPTETLDKMESDGLEYITLDKVKEKGTKVEEDKENKRKQTSIKDSVNTLKQKFIDRGSAIYDLGRKTKSDIYAWYNNYRNASSMADYQIYKKGGWADIINEIPKDQQNDFSYMMYHWLNTDTYKYKKPVFGDITDKQSQQIVDQYLEEHPTWKDTAQKVWDYEKDLREELVKHGRISRQTANTWEEMYPHYVHIVRDSVDINKVPNAIQTEQEKVKSSNKGTVQERTGGNSPLRSLNDAITQQTKQVYSAVTMNDFVNEYVKVAKPSVKVWEDYQDRSIDAIDKSIGNEIQAPDENTPATFIFYDNGDTRTIEVPADIYNAFVVDKVMDNKLTDITTKANSIRRNLITTMNLMFTPRNFVKDVQDVLYKSEHPKLTYSMMPQAVVDMAKNSETYQLYRSLGGGSSSITKGSKFYDATVGNVERANNFVETLPRYAEFKASLAAGRTPTQSMYDADKVTTNFKMGGDWTKFADRNGFTFLNASVEGFNELYRDYQSAYDKKGWKGILGKLAMATLVFNVPLMVANHLRWKDDEDYQNLSDYVKDNYYILWKNNDGTFARVNKGRIAATYQKILQTIWDNGVELVSGDSNTEKAKKMWENSLDAIETSWDNIGINNPVKNNIVSPIIDVINNKTWYGEDLLSDYELNKDASEQYDYTTDALSKWIGQNTNTSPIKWNYLLDQYSGGIGDVVLPMLTPKAETMLDDGTIGGKVSSALLSPIVDDFTVDPVFKNQNVSDLFDLDTELSKRASKTSASDEEKVANKYISSIKYQMFKLYGDRADIYNDESLTDAEKYRQARTIQQQIDELAKYGLDSYDNIDMVGRYAQVGDIPFYKNENNEWAKVDADTIEEMESLNMTTSQRNTYYELKEEITGTNKIKTLLGYYDSLEELKTSNKYSTTYKNKKIKELQEKIASAEKKFTADELAQIKKKGSIDARTTNFDAIANSDLTDEQKNYMYDKYYGTKTGEFINELDLSDSEKMNLKYAVSQAIGLKDANGKTISNSKASQIAGIYEQAGVLDNIIAYMEANNLNPSDFGLSKTVYNNYNGTTASSKQKKAAQAYMKAIKSANSDLMSYLNNMTSIEDAIKNVEKIKAKYKK